MSPGRATALRLTLRVAALGLGLPAAPAAAQTYTLPWWTVDGGGATGASGGSYRLSGTIGQPDAGPAQLGQGYAVSGGFWGVALAAGGAQADLSIATSDSPDPVVGLQPLTYTLAVANGGPDPATAVTVSDTLPAGVVFQSAGGAGWTCGEAAGVVTCQRPSLAMGPAPNIAVVVTPPPAAGTLSNLASVSAVENDPAPANNSDTEPTTVTAAPASNLFLDKIAGAAEARWGQPFTYLVTLSNFGPQDVSGARVTDTVPPGFTGASWTCATSNGSSCPPSGSGDIDAAITLLVGGDVTFTVTGTVAPGTASLVNTAAVALPAGHHDPDLANNRDTVTTPGVPVRFHPLTPCRVIDTRSSDPPALAADSLRRFDVAGRCGIPMDAVAVASSLAAVNPTDIGNLRLFPDGAPEPLASAINFRAGHTRANNAIVPLGDLGRILVRCDMPPGSSGQTHFLFDVTGYFR
jgi:uncharacterized repeat protein (TIGR01451 family)